MIKPCFFRKTNFLSALVAVIMGSLLQGCIFGGGNMDGELIGVERQGWQQDLPYGMVVIPPGTFHMGQADQDIASSKMSSNKQITIGGFYMDDTEITNTEYRQFLYVLLGEDIVLEKFGEIEEFGMKAFEDAPPLEEMINTQGGLGGDSTIFQRYKTKLPAIEESDDIYNELYPDTTVWMKDFTYHLGDPLTQYYFYHPAYNNYPVVGVTWTQALLFCEWRTKYMNYFRAEDGQFPMPNFRLPSEAEWEYAARGGRDMAKYPWGGPYVRNAKGCALANFKPGRGNYYDDGFSYTAPVASYFANDYGLYDMAGNVSEWVEDAFSPASYPIVWDLNPVYFDANEPRKVVRGGSWKDIAFLIETGTRTYDHEDSSRSFVGFRCAMTYLGRSSGFEF